MKSPRSFLLEIENLNLCYKIDRVINNRCVTINYQNKKMKSCSIWWNARVTENRKAMTYNRLKSVCQGRKRRNSQSVPTSMFVVSESEDYGATVGQRLRALTSFSLSVLICTGVFLLQVVAILLDFILVNARSLVFRPHQAAEWTTTLHSQQHSRSSIRVQPCWL